MNDNIYSGYDDVEFLVDGDVETGKGRELIEGVLRQAINDGSTCANLNGPMLSRLGEVRYVVNGVSYELGMGQEEQALGRRYVDSIIDKDVINSSTVLHFNVKDKGAEEMRKGGFITIERTNPQPGCSPSTIDYQFEIYDIRKISDAFGEAGLEMVVREG